MCALFIPQARLRQSGSPLPTNKVQHVQTPFAPLFPVSLGDIAQQTQSLGHPSVPRPANQIKKSKEPPYSCASLLRLRHAPTFPSVPIFRIPIVDQPQNEPEKPDALSPPKTPGPQCSTSPGRRRRSDRGYISSIGKNENQKKPARIFSKMVLQGRVYMYCMYVRRCRVCVCVCVYLENRGGVGRRNIMFGVVRPYHDIVMKAP